MTADDQAVTHGFLLGGRLHYTQKKDGYRTGLEPVLLAAAVPARSGQRVLEAGTGAGAGLLCLLARVPGLDATGIELDPGTAALARANLAANGFAGRIVTADVDTAPALGLVDHAFANPPWHDPAGTPPSGEDRQRAKQLPPDGLRHWIDHLAAVLAPRGTLSLLLPAGLLTEAVSGLDRAGLRETMLLPLWPRAGVAAKLVILRARRGAGPSRVLPGLALHDGAGLSDAAEQVLRSGAALAD